jgi:pre-mRNA-splicing factor CWC22
LNMRSGGVYIPPARLRALQAQITDKTSKEYQRLAWDALKKSINGLINKVNTGNIKHIVPELFQENLIRGRGKITGVPILRPRTIYCKDSC